jgi:hypothetical protein
MEGRMKNEIVAMMQRVQAERNEKQRDQEGGEEQTDIDPTEED